MELTREKLYEIVSQAVKERVTMKALGSCQHYTKEIMKYLEDNYPELKVFRGGATEAPKTTDILGIPDPHAYLLVSDGKSGFIVDGSISQYITHFEDLSEEVLGQRQSYFVGTRNELKQIVQKAQDNTLKYIKEYGVGIIDVNKTTKLSDIDAKNVYDADLLKDFFSYTELNRDGTKAKWNETKDDTKDLIPFLETAPNYPVIIHHQPSRLFEQSWGTKSVVRVPKDYPQSEIDELKSVLNNEIAISRIGGHLSYEPNDFKKRGHKMARKSSFIAAEYDRTNDKPTLPFL